MKFLVSGLGSIGLRHAKNLIALGHEVYGSDIDYHKLEEAQNHGVRVYYHKMDVVFDAVIIARPTENHGDALTEAIQDMSCHVFIEKPLSDEIDKSLELDLATAKEKGFVVMVGNNLRFRHGIQKAKAQLADIGQLRCAAFILSQNNFKYRDHVILNWGAHELDLARYLLGPCKVVACVGNREIANIILKHDNGCQTSIHLDYVGRPETREFVVVGNLGRVRCDLVAAKDNDESYITEMKAFINRIRGGEDSIGASDQDGLETLKLITAAMEMAGK